MLGGGDQPRVIFDTKVVLVPENGGTGVDRRAGFHPGGYGGGGDAEWSFGSQKSSLWGY